MKVIVMPGFQVNKVPVVLQAKNDLLQRQTAFADHT
jgi:hypothetical protein